MLVLDRIVILYFCIILFDLHIDFHIDSIGLTECVILSFPDMENVC